MKIGIFDSGIGGVTVLNRVRDKYPDIDIVFFGDTLRLPYGEKTKEQILTYSREIVKFLIDKEVSVILIACNTATSLALDELKKEFNLPIIGTIDPVVDKLISKNYNNVGLIATSSTVNSNKYFEAIKNRNKDINLISKATPLFVPVIEEGITKGPIIDELCNIYIDNMKDKIESLILGCTHYSTIENSISTKYPNIEIVNSSFEIVDELEKYISDRNNKKGKVEFYISGNQDKFRSNIKKIFAIEDANIFGGNINV